MGKRSECSAAMQLLCLLLSARGRPKEALSTATAALEDHPDSMDLLRILALLQLRCEGGEVCNLYCMLIILTIIGLIIAYCDHL